MHLYGPRVFINTDIQDRLCGRQILNLSLTNVKILGLRSLGKRKKKKNKFNLSKCWLQQPFNDMFWRNDILTYLLSWP